MSIINNFSKILEDKLELKISIDVSDVNLIISPIIKLDAILIFFVYLATSSNQSDILISLVKSFASYSGRPKLTYLFCLSLGVQEVLMTIF